MTEHAIVIECDDYNQLPEFWAVCSCAGYTSRRYARKRDAQRAGNLHARSFEGRRLAVWQQQPCPSWCVVQHHDADRPIDRWHESEWANVERPTMTAVQTADGKWRARRFGVRLEQGANNFGTGVNGQVYVVAATEVEDGEYAKSATSGAAYLKFSALVALDVAESIRRAACAAMTDQTPS